MRNVNGLGLNMVNPHGIWRSMRRGSRKAMPKMMIFPSVLGRGSSGPSGSLVDCNPQLPGMPQQLGGARTVAVHDVRL